MKIEPKKHGDAKQVANRVGAPSAISADLLKPVPARFNLLMISLVLLVAAFVGWSSYAKLDEIIKGEGRVIPVRKLQLVQNLEGGIIREILVKEGQEVRRGDVLLRIDPTQANSSVAESLEKIAGLRAIVIRLRAELDDSEPAFAKDFVDRRPTLVADQRAYFYARQRQLKATLSVLSAQEQQKRQEILELEAKIETLTRSLELANAEQRILKPLLATGAASRSELLTIEAKVNDTTGSLTAAQLAIPRIRSQLAEIAEKKQERKSAFRSDALQKLTRARVELNALQKATLGAEDKLARTTVRAPATGIIKTIRVTTVGEVVQPGHNLVEIVPLHDTLLVEARIQPKDIAFLRPGQSALVKLTAYDFSLYGGMDGRVEQVGADSVTNDQGETYYLIKVRTGRGQFESKGKALRIIPGMVAEVDVLTGKKTVMAYLTKPLTRMRHNAMRER